ncbi:polysaccharide biosynthesis protein [Tsukamurella pulmonis]|uniref:Membrane protein involved in the export of O-antigen and teichoic acid n=1 Tax=Tsukamurella pulmonis TaxID=47312 RepID=A0A1H1F9G0_9ACTN|nr:oligosaccharide flippase family protein [Tsukamurella pulmonis]KXO88663.1 polysaccharide biosynthesis protein [Tsukamurella pulmonis]SDQ97066.1 Membrane protein involved in the export of O-antigen and teichoic acid [Tsukamurella pulmonis]SUP19928.1 Polysaccharide biosynthesis protein [Tsukamurella pulmonis]
MSPALLRGGAGLARDVVLVSAGRYGQYAVTLITIPLCARLLGPTGMGLLAVAMSTYFLGALCTDLGITAFVSARAEQPGLARLRGDYAGLRAGALVLFVALLLLALLTPVPRAVELGALGLVVGSVSACGDDWVLLGRGRFGAVVVQQSAGRLLYLALLLLALPQVRTPEAAMACLLAGNLVAVGWSWARTVRDYGPPARPGPPGPLLRTGGPVLTARLLSSSYGPGAATVFSPALTPQALGQFSASDRPVQAAGSLLDAVGVSLLPRLARRDGGAFWVTARRGILLVGLGGTVLAALATVLAPWVLPLLFGADFDAAVPLLQIQAWALPGLAVASFVATAVLPVLGDARGVLLAGTVGAAVIAIALLLTLRTHDPRTVVLGVVAAQTAAAGFSVLRARRREGAA